MSIIINGVSTVTYEDLIAIGWTPADLAIYYPNIPHDSGVPSSTPAPAPTTSGDTGSVAGAFLLMIGLGLALGKRKRRKKVKSKKLMR